MKLPHISPICIIIYWHLVLARVFLSVSQCWKVCLQLSAVGIPFCDLKITMSTSFLTSLYASFSKSFVNAEQPARDRDSTWKTSSQASCSGAHKIFGIPRGWRSQHCSFMLCRPIICEYGTFSNLTGAQPQRFGGRRTAQIVPLQIQASVSLFVKRNTILSSGMEIIIVLQSHKVLLQRALRQGKS